MYYVVLVRIELKLEFLMSYHPPSFCRKPSVGANNNPPNNHLSIRFIKIHSHVVQQRIKCITCDCH